MKTPKKVEILFCYETEEEFGGDYNSVEVAFDGKTVASFGDYYHDKGSDRAKAFIQGAEFALGVELPKASIKEVVREL